MTVLLQGLEHGVLTLTLNREDRLNTLNDEISDALTAAVRSAAEDPAVDVIVLRGAGRAFCAGGDINSIVDEASGLSFEAMLSSLRSSMETARLLHDTPKPTIAMLRGAVAGAGLALALACDLRIASETLKLTTAFVKVGLSGDYGGSYFMSRLVGSAKARELYMMSPVIDAQEAFRIGLISRLVTDDDLEPTVQQIAGDLAKGPRLALSYIKQNMNFAEHASLDDLLDVEAMRHTQCRRSEDHLNAVAEFLDKRRRATAQ
jgi:2-(1,2-epoxy-1,2-dihydrophenyl)acetyl-CoA isomerase